ncbi:MAG: SAM-dependent methyltransferase [Variibacter sp.]|nr:SAM-dependent methyltransferase [Variibacter sp.]
MALCLAHPRHGYYLTRDPLGRAGDFTTAPEVSQMFGELLGLWAVAVWQLMGAPAQMNLVELGPGRGTLMADGLRAARLAPAFLAAAEVHLVEISPVLRARQRAALAAAPVAVQWHDALEAVPAGPAIVLANEFFDALPVNQAVKTARGWHERLVGLDPRGRLAFGLAPAPLPGFAQALPGVRGAPPGAIFEWRDPAPAQALGRRAASAGGAALIVDYGHTESAAGDTFQALRRHGYADPLASPGEADLTAHVDFAALAADARAAGATVHGPVTQGHFLRTLGIAARAARLQENASASQRKAVDEALERLTGGSAGKTAGMGDLFKVLALAHPALPPLPGFAM